MAKWLTDAQIMHELMVALDYGEKEEATKMKGKEDYFDVEGRVMRRFHELRPQHTFLQTVVEILDMEFEDVKYADEVIKCIIANEQ